MLVMQRQQQMHWYSESKHPWMPQQEEQQQQQQQHLCRVSLTMPPLTVRHKQQHSQVARS
jgi:hypothetical protein